MADSEVFWVYDNLLKIKTHTKQPIMLEHPSMRYDVLLKVDWASSFKAMKKTHKEHRNWLVLLAGNRRIMLLHGVSFGFLAAAKINTAPPDTWGVGGWGGWGVMPYILVIPALSKFIGHIVARSLVGPEELKRYQSLAQCALLQVFLSIGCLIITLSIMNSTTYTEVSSHHAVYAVPRHHQHVCFMLLSLWCPCSHYHCACACVR